MFMPGRMTFQFNVESTMGTELPTTVVRSKADIISQVGCVGRGPLRAWACPMFVWSAYATCTHIA